MLNQFVGPWKNVNRAVASVPREQPSIDPFTAAILAMNSKPAGAEKTRVTKTSTPTYMDQMQFEKNYQATAGMPQMQAQQKYVDQIKGLGDARLQAMSAPQLDLSSIAALVDSETGSNFQQGYAKPLSAQDLHKQASQAAQQMLGAEQSQQKQIMDMMKARQTGNTITTLTDKEGSKGGTTTASVRRNKLISDAGKSFDKDKILLQITKTNNSLDRARGMINGDVPLNAKNFALLQQDMIDAMAPGGAATEGKVSREMVDTLASDLNSFATYAGSIKDLRKTQPQMFEQLLGLINQVQGEYNHAGLERVGELEINYMNVPDELILKTVSDKTKNLRAKFNKTKAAHKKDSGTGDDARRKRYELLKARHATQ